MANFLFITFAISFSLFFTGVFSLKCWQCGQYNDGVGSITPCINETYMKLTECPSVKHNFCIKYISEASTVKDCVPTCTEKEDWGEMTFCCNEDGCNSVEWVQSNFKITFYGFLLILILTH